MKTKEVFEEKDKLEEEINKVQELLNRLNNKSNEITKLCQHEIVFKYKDNYPRKMAFDGNYFCPACGITIKCFNKEQIKESIFNNSRIIPITHLSLFGTKEVYKAIKKEVYDNYDLYYDYIIPEEELSYKMEEELRDKQLTYEGPEISIKKLTR